VIYCLTDPDGRFHQGEILSNVKQGQIDPDSIGADSPPVLDFVVHPIVVVLTQDCDLASDYQARFMPDGSGIEIACVTLCPAQEAKVLRDERDEINSRTWAGFQRNMNERYHYLAGVPAGLDAAERGTPALALDFKRFLTLPTAELYKRVQVGEAKRRSRLAPPYREHLSTRFFYYHYRIALPKQHHESDAESGDEKGSG
jgi:hypothetical protein